MSHDPGQGAPPPPQQPQQPAQPPPQHGGQPQWGAPPAPPQYGGQPQWGAPPAPPQYGGQPQWGAPPAPPQYGGQPQWGAPPPPPQYGAAAGAPAGPAPGWGGGGPQMWLQRPKPGIIPLRPISLGEILDGAFQAIRTNPRTMIGVSAVVVALATLVSSVPSAALLMDVGDSALLTPGAAVTGADFASFLTDLLRAQLPTYVVTLLSVALLTALLTIAVSNAVLGVRTPLRALWTRVRGRLGGVLVLSLLLTVLSLGVPGLLLVPGLVVLRTDPLVGGLLLLLGLAAAVPVYLALATKLGLAGPALLLEDRSAVDAVRRSWTLTSGSFWRVLGILLLAGIIQAVGASVVGAPFGLVSGLIGADSPTLYADFWQTLAQLLVAGIGATIGGAIFYPFAAAVTTLLYLDLRMRREALDVELVRHAESGTAT